MSLVRRPAGAADYPHFARLFPKLATGDPVPPPDVWARDLAPHTWLFEQHGEVVGYLYFERLAGTGYIRHVVVAPTRRGCGLGAAFLRAAASDLRAAGCTRWCLNVKPDNLPAVALYRKLGLREVYRSTALRFPWQLVDRLAPPDRSLGTCPIEPEEDAACERAFDLPPGQLAQLRARARTVLVRLRDPDDPAAVGLGLAAFAVDFPGAFPFRVAHPSYAAPLLAGLRPHARPDRPEMNIVAEADPELDAAMRAAGAEVKLEFAHYAGDLPDPA
ncbi:MAG TPA: GNAT family N-acetyltransferase [Nannocystis sp.]